jgi:hypothetical protein
MSDLYNSSHTKPYRCKNSGKCDIIVDFNKKINKGIDAFGNTGCNGADPTYDGFIDRDGNLRLYISPSFCRACWAHRVYGRKKLYLTDISTSKHISCLFCKKKVIVSFKEEVQEMIFDEDDEVITMNTDSFEKALKIKAEANRRALEDYYYKHDNIGFFTQVLCAISESFIL